MPTRKIFFLLSIFFCFQTLCIRVYGQNIDINLLHKINSYDSNFGDRTFSFLSATATPLAISTPLVTLGLGVFKKDKVLKKQAFLIASEIAAAMLISTALKYSINRTRPFDKYDFINNKTDDFTPSFPSGHTTSAFATATSISLLKPRWYVIAVSYLWAASVGYSRLYLGVHYPSDVLAGALIGTGTSLLTWKINNIWSKKIERKKQNSQYLE